MDEFEHLLRNGLNKNFGIDFVTANIRISFPEVGEFEICQLDIQSTQIPVVVSMKDKNGQIQEKFYVRRGSSSQETIAE